MQRLTGRGTPPSTTATAPPPLGRPLALALVCAWALVTIFASTEALLGVAGRGEVDFFTFLDSTTRWQQGLDPYAQTRLVGTGATAHLAHPNLNHPLTIPLFIPFTRLHPLAAFLLWDALGLLAALLALILAHHALDWPRSATARIATAALVACYPGVIYGVQLGQWGLLLTLPVTLLWLLLRDPPLDPDRRRLLLAGLLCGVLLALKPFLLPLAAFFLPRRRWAGLLAVAGGGSAVSLLAVPFVGLTAYAEWLVALRGVDWYNHGMNISLFGLLNRLVTPAPPAVLGWLLQGLAGLLGAALILRAQADTRAARDRSIGLLLVLSLLGSPLGWLYYTPLLLPALLPLLATWSRLTPRSRAALVLTCLLLWTPHILLALLPTGLLLELTLRALPTYGLLALLLFLLRSTPTPIPERGAGWHPAPESSLAPG